MSAPLVRSLRVVLYEGVGSRSIPDADRFAMMVTLLQGGYAVTSVRTGARTAPEGVSTPIVVLGRFEHTPPREAESDSGGARIFFRNIEGVGTLTEKLLTFALGRGIETYDGPAVREVVRKGKTADFRFSALIEAIVTSTPFQMRTSQSTS